MADKNTVPVFPGPGQLEELATALIRLADHPHDVVWQSRGGYFDVPEEVAVRYAEEQGVAADEETAAEPAPAKQPRQRRRAAAAAKKTTAAAADKPAAEPAKPRSRASRSSKKKGGES